MKPNPYWALPVGHVASMRTALVLRASKQLGLALRTPAGHRQEQEESDTTQA